MWGLDRSTRSGKGNAKARVPYLRTGGTSPATAPSVQPSVGGFSTCFTAGDATSRRSRHIGLSGRLSLPPAAEAPLLPPASFLLRRSVCWLLRVGTRRLRCCVVTCVYRKG